MDCLCNSSCDFDSGEACFAWDESNPIARKEHTCFECGKTTKKGEKYSYLKAGWENIGRQTIKTCMGCARLRRDVCAAVGDLREHIIETCGEDLL